MRKSIFVRYALSYTLVLILLFAGLSFYLVRDSQTQIRTKIVENQVNRLTRIALEHEGYLSALMSMAEEMGLSPQIEPFRYEQHPGRAYELQTQLAPYTVINRFCDQIYLLFAGEDRMYSSSASMTLERFLQMMDFEGMAPETLSLMLREAEQPVILPARTVRSSLIDGSESREVSFILPMGSTPGTSKGTLLCLVKEQVYRNMFADAIDTDLNTYIFYGDSVLASEEDLPVNAGEVAPPEETGEYSRVFSSQGKDWLAVTLGNRAWNMRYVTVLPMSAVNTEISRGLQRTTAILAGFLLLSLGGIFWTARHHARPIERLSGLVAAEGLEQKDALTKLSSGIRQLTEANSALSTRLDQTLPMQKRDFVFRFVKGRFADGREAAETARNLGLDIGKKFYAVILCSASEEWERPLDLTREPLAALRGVTAVGAELVAMRANLFLGFADEPAALQELAERIRGQESGEGGGVTAISAMHSAPEEAPAAYLEAAAAYDNRFVMGQDRVLTYEDLSASVEEVLPRAQKITNGISQALALKNPERLNDQIGELLRFLKNTSMSPFAFRMIYNDVIDTLTRSQAAKFADGRTARDLYDIFTLTSCQSIDDLDAMLRRLCGQLMQEEAGEERGTPPDQEEDPIDQAVRYIDAHFTDPEISMGAIAEAIDLSTTRLSLSFKERMGMTPSDYLTLLRSEKAKGLLRETDWPIREIGAQVGYYDAGSFIRRFKQVVGETPLQYRKTVRGASPAEHAKDSAE